MSFARVEGEPQHRPIGAGAAADERPTMSRRIASRRLDLDDLGAEITQEFSGEMAGLGRDVEDPEPVEIADGDGHGDQLACMSHQVP